MLSMLRIKTFFSSSAASNKHRAWHNKTFKNARYARWTRHPARLLTWRYGAVQNPLNFMFPRS